MRLLRLTPLATLIVSLLAAPLAVEADRAPRIPRIGLVLIILTADQIRSVPLVKAPLEGMKELSWVQGRDFTLDVRSAEGDFERVPDLVAGLVAEKVDLMLSFECHGTFHIARRLTSTIPIVIGPLCYIDLVGKRIVASLARPGGNITGISSFTPTLSAQRLSLLKEVVPTMSRVAVLEAVFLDLRPESRQLRAAAAAMAVTLHSVDVRSPDTPNQSSTTSSPERRPMDSSDSRVDTTYYTHATLLAFRPGPASQASTCIGTS